MEFDVVNPPDETARQAAVERHARLTKPLGALGRLEELGTWLAACQGQSPPKPLTRPRVVVFAGDHGVASRGVSAYPPEVTAQMVANFQAGGAAINVLAELAGATVRVVDLAVAEDTTAADHKVRRSSGAIDREDALTEAEVAAALAAGKAIADEEVDAGADLLVAGDMGIGNTTPAAVLVAAITGAEPVAVVGRGTGIDDQTWMRKTAAIRDALRRAKPVTADPTALLRTIAGADITAMAAFLAQAAIRRTPVVLDGVVSGAAALLAEELAPGARAWWVAGHRSTEPAHTLVLDQLDLKPLLELNMRLGEGSGATAAIPLLRMAAQVLTDMSTFESAGVTDRTTSPAKTPSADDPSQAPTPPDDHSTTTTSPSSQATATAASTTPAPTSPTEEAADAPAASSPTAADPATGDPAEDGSAAATPAPAASPTGRTAPTSPVGPTADAPADPASPDGNQVTEAATETPPRGPAGPETPPASPANPTTGDPNTTPADSRDAEAATGTPPTKHGPATTIADTPATDLSTSNTGTTTDPSPNTTATTDGARGPAPSSDTGPSPNTTPTTDSARATGPSTDDLGATTGPSPSATATTDGGPATGPSTNNTGAPTGPTPNTTPTTDSGPATNPSTNNTDTTTRPSPNTTATTDDTRGTAPSTNNPSAPTDPKPSTTPTTDSAPGTDPSPR